ncbi:O-methyltransferase [Catenuloplanes atrovinosus]|uniref:Caffeoyl-CoA O-methyltransferase n=1 Tax=Catenuloplanes atrovinosus TaxID=137266 RepID=A0AAE3YY71_9ACTN|nr:O-methyltransferase [Catenuloplanes atrovinosus]MDR7280765.1 caffeoyl-CoA O-methyltransferase [Catenuloplanes atrovinosus]
MDFKTLPHTPELYAYALAHGMPLDDVFQELIRETRATLGPDEVAMQVSPEQAGLLTMLTRLVGARTAVEVGTFTGLSSLAIARGLPEDGRLTCFDISEEYTSVARRYWERAGVDKKIELRIGPAAEGLRELPAEPHLDLVFIDADKVGYPTYWSELVPRMRPGGLLIIDNVLRHGRVLDPRNDGDRAMVRFNDIVATDDRVDAIVLPLADGITLARRR